MTKQNTQRAEVPTPADFTVKGAIAYRDAVVKQLNKAKTFSKDVLTTHPREVKAILHNIPDENGLDLAHKFGTGNARLMVLEIYNTLLLGTAHIKTPTA